MKRQFFVSLVVVALGCVSPSTNLNESVELSFAPCSAEAIQLQATRHNLMTAFAPCGNNAIEHFAWSPDGERLYFQLVFTAYVMNAASDRKEVTPVPVAGPVGPAIWASPSRLVVPVPADEGQKGVRLAIVDVDAPAVYHHPLPEFARVRSLTSGRDHTEVLLLGEDERGQGLAVRHDLGSAQRTAIAPWLTEAPASLSYEPTRGLLVLGDGQEVRVVREATGEVLGRYAPAARGVLHPREPWLALEHEGEPVSIFYQAEWDDLPPRQREREVAKVEQYIQRLPPGYPVEVRPPTLSFVHLPSGRRYLLDAAQGRAFSWYNAMPHFGTFLLWGFDRREVKRNVVLGNFRDRLNHMAEDKPMMGIRKMDGGVSTPLPNLDPPAPPAQEPIQDPK